MGLFEVTAPLKHQNLKVVIIFENKIDRVFSELLLQTYFRLGTCIVAHTRLHACVHLIAVLGLIMCALRPEIRPDHPFDQSVRCHSRPVVAILRYDKIIMLTRIDIAQTIDPDPLSVAPR